METIEQQFREAGVDEKHIETLTKAYVDSDNAGVGVSASTWVTTYFAIMSCDDSKRHLDSIESLNKWFERNTAIMEKDPPPKSNKQFWRGLYE